MKLHKLQVLIGQISSGDHGGAVSGAGVRGRAGEVRASVATSSEYRILGVETMKCSVFQTERNHSSAFSILHQQVQGKVLDEVVAIVAQRLAVERVQQRVAGSVRHAAASVSLAAFAELQRLTTKSALIDLA